MFIRREEFEILKEKVEELEKELWEYTKQPTVILTNPPFAWYGPEEKIADILKSLFKYLGVQLVRSDKLQIKKKK